MARLANLSADDGDGHRPRHANDGPGPAGRLAARHCTIHDCDRECPGYLPEIERLRPACGTSILVSCGEYNIHLSVFNVLH